MPEKTAVRTDSLPECLAIMRKRLGNHWIVGAPLGLGKPNHLVNAIYQQARSDPTLQLELFTALSLNPPKPASGLKQRFLGPFLQRQFGNYPRLDYLRDLDHEAVPENICISEFYMRSGSRLGNVHAQSHYVSSNYTHVARDMQARGINLVVQMVAPHPQRPDRFSLSCNPDVTLDLLSRVPREQLLVVVQVNDQLPYMGGDAEIGLDQIDLVLEGHPQPLFAVPRMPVGVADMMIGLHASRLVRDGGTLQLGIGSLGDAVSFFLCLRQQQNPVYRELLDAVGNASDMPLEQHWGGRDPFESGLYAASEMFTEGFLHLYRAGVLKRRVYDHAGLQQLLSRGKLQERLADDTLEILWQEDLLPRHLEAASLAWLQQFGILKAGVRVSEERILLPDDSELANDLSTAESRQKLSRAALGQALQGGALLHAAFFLGSAEMYRSLRDMSAEERSLFQMTAVSRVNQLYRGEELDRAQRLEARLVNTTMKMTLLGAAASDQLENGQVVSGVGGQYNFVAMAHALDRARSVLMLRSHRGVGDQAVSNIVWEFPHATIPRHLRDIVITEYGIADLRSASDEECIQRLLCVADSRWQASLQRHAVKAGKLSPGWRIPQHACSNTPERLRQGLRPFQQRGVIEEYPFGSDFTDEELHLSRALPWLQRATTGWRNRAATALAAWQNRTPPSTSEQACLLRMGLDAPENLSEKLQQRLLRLALKSTST